jgi:hypothetical protein
MISGMNQFGFEDVNIAVYDPSKKELIKSFSTIKKAALFVGISESSIKQACTSKKRRYSPKLDMEVAIRYKKK